MSEAIDEATEQTLNLLRDLALLEAALVSEDVYLKNGAYQAVEFVESCQRARKAIVPVVAELEKTAPRSARLGLREAPTAHELVLWIAWQREKALREAAGQRQQIPSGSESTPYLCDWLGQYEPTADNIHEGMMEIRARGEQIVLSYSGLRTQLRQEQTAAKSAETKRKAKDKRRRRAKGGGRAPVDLKITDELADKLASKVADRLPKGRSQRKRGGQRQFDAQDDRTKFGRCTDMMGQGKSQKEAARELGMTVRDLGRLRERVRWHSRKRMRSK